MKKGRALARIQYTSQLTRQIVIRIRGVLSNHKTAQQVITPTATKPLVEHDKILPATTPMFMFPAMKRTRSDLFGLHRLIDKFDPMRSIAPPTPALQIR